MTKIEWTHAPSFKGETWNRLFGFFGVNVVSGNKPAWPVKAVKLFKSRAAPTRARYSWVFLAGLASEWIASMGCVMMPHRLHHLKVFRPVVRFDPINMVDNLALPQSAANLFRGHEAMLINIAAHIRHWVSSALYKDIPIRRYCAPSLPVWVLFSGLAYHTQRVALGCRLINNNLKRKYNGPS